MVIEKRRLDLLSLLESHTGDATPEVPVVPKAPTLASPPPTQTNPIEKKRKWEKKCNKRHYRGGPNSRRDPPRANQGSQGHPVTTEEACKSCRDYSWAPPLDSTLEPSFGLGWGSPHLEFLHPRFWQWESKLCCQLFGASTPTTSRHGRAS